MLVISVGVILEAMAPSTSETVHFSGLGVIAIGSGALHVTAIVYQAEW